MLLNRTILSLDSSSLIMKAEPNISSSSSSPVATMTFAVVLLGLSGQSAHRCPFTRHPLQVRVSAVPFFDKCERPAVAPRPPCFDTAPRPAWFDPRPAATYLGVLVISSARTNTECMSDPPAIFVVAVFQPDAIDHAECRVNGNALPRVASLVR